MEKIDDVLRVRGGVGKVFVKVTEIGQCLLRGIDIALKYLVQIG
jgi:hypothetical protein